MSIDNKTHDALVAHWTANAKKHETRRAGNRKKAWYFNAKWFPRQGRPGSAGS